MSALSRHSVGMGIYSHLSTEKLTEMRDSLMQALMSRHTDPARVSGNGRDLTFKQEGIGEIRKDLDAINAELGRRNGTSSRGPIYLMN